MNELGIKELNQNKKLSMQGLACQSLFFIFSLICAIWTGSILYGAMLLISIAWLPIWWMFYSKYNLMIKQFELTTQDNLNDLEIQDLECVNESLRRLNRRMALHMNLIFGGILFIGGSNNIYQIFKHGTSPITVNIRMLMAFSGVVAFLSLISYYYLAQLVQKNREFNSGVQGIRFFSLTLFFGIIVLICGYAGIPKVWFIALILINLMVALIGLECFLKLFFELFRPKKKGDISRPAYESYILECLKEPTQWKKTVKEVINNQLGFEATQNRFFHALASLVLPFILFSILFSFLLSSVSIISPSEKGVVFSFGNITGKILDPGVHLIAPYPFNTVKKIDIWKVRRTFIGSHQPLQKNGIVFKKNVPLLWTNHHGVSNDELLIVAPPVDLMDKTNRLVDNGKAPSISLASLDIVVEYRIKDIVKYLKSSVNPDEFFKQIAETATSRSLFQYDIDTLFCKGRIILPDALKVKIQKAADNMQLGIKVLNVGIGGVHPPQEVADAFHETVTAEQENKTAIELAEQYRSKIITETVGSAEMAEQIFNEIQNIENGKANSKELTYKLLTSSSGKISQLLDQALAYKWHTENIERGKAERFQKELLLYNAAPRTYLMSYYMSVLELGLANAKKYMLIGNRENLLLRFNFTDINSVVPDNENMLSPILENVDNTK